MELIERLEKILAMYERALIVEFKIHEKGLRSLPTRELEPVMRLAAMIESMRESKEKKQMLQAIGQAQQKAKQDAREKDEANKAELKKALDIVKELKMMKDFFNSEQ